MVRDQRNLVIYFMPSLITLLENFQEEKGRTLTKEEVISVRDQAIAMTVSHERLVKLEESRGYRDLDPENVWEEWQGYISV